MPFAPPTNILTSPVLSPLLCVAPQMPMLPCNSCLTMCPTKCCHPMEGRGNEEEGGFGWKKRKGGCWICMGVPGSWILIFSFFLLPSKELRLSLHFLSFSCVLMYNWIFQILATLCVLFPHSVTVSFSLILFWIWLRWWPAPMFPSWPQESPGSKVEEGTSASRSLLIGVVG